VIYKQEGIRGGKPLLKGTRIPVQDILEHLALGWSIPQLKKVFPTLDLKNVERLLKDISKDYKKG
jgi:uncharacterized protein (DUF433 family)